MNETEATEATEAAAIVDGVIVDEQVEAQLEQLAGKSYKLFPSPADAAKSWEAVQGFGIPTASARAIDAEEWSGQQVMLTIIRRSVQLEGWKAARNCPAAIVLIPCPTIEQLLESEAGLKWLEGKAVQGLRQNAVRAGRDEIDAATLAAEIGALPVDVAGLVARARSGGFDLALWDKAYGKVRESVVKQNAFLKGRLPSKGEMLKCIRSASYAAATEPVLEEAGFFQLFNAAVIASAERYELSPTQQEAFIASREDVHLTPPKSVTEDLVSQIKF